MLNFTKAAIATFVILGWVCPARAQALKVVEKIAERVSKQGGQQVSRSVIQRGAAGLERQVVLGELEEAAQLLSRPLVSNSEELLLKRFNRLPGVDDALRAEFRALSLGERQVVVELGEGVRVLLHRYPEEGIILLQRLNGGGLAQARTYGDFVLEGAHWLHQDEVLQALQTSRLTPEEVAGLSRALQGRSQAETLTMDQVMPLWKNVIRKTGEGAGAFWGTYIKPHKGKWLAGGLLASYLVLPEKFHDGAGNLTEYASRKLSELGISVGTGVVRGAVNGPIEAVQKHYAADPLGTILGLLAIAVLLVLALPQVRFRLWGGLSRLLTRSGTRPTRAKGFSSHQPFRE